MTTTNSIDITWHFGAVKRIERENLLSQKGCTIWFTGLPSSGKSTTAFALERELVRLGHLAYVLDGDNIRHGLNSDLGFSAQGRKENIRRIGEVAKLIADVGIICITSFISPYREDRELARSIHNDAGIHFIEAYVNTPIDICECRDPKSLYKKARVGELKGFTGIDDPYEIPLNPELRINTEISSPEDLAAFICRYMTDCKIFDMEFRESSVMIPVAYRSSL